MAEVTKPFDLIIDIKKPVVNEPFEVTEGDNGNILVIEIQKDGSPVDLTDCLVTVVFSHSEKTFEQDSDTVGGDVTISGTSHNIVTVVLHSSSYAPDGITECEIKIASGATQSTWITTPPFTIKSRRALLNDETITAVVEFPILQTLITRVEGLEAREQANWTETNDQLGTFIRNKPVVGTDFQSATQVLTEESSVLTTDIAPFYRSTGTAHHFKSTVSALISLIKTTFFSSTTGIAKLDGAGNVSAAVPNTDFAAATHASRHAYGAADAIATDATPTSASTYPLQSGGAYAALAVKADLSSGIVTQAQARSKLIEKTASFTLAATDIEAVLLCNSSSAMTVTIPLDSAYNAPIGTCFSFIRWGTGTLTFVKDASANWVTLNNVTAVSVQGGAATLLKAAANVWWLSCN